MELVSILVPVYNVERFLDKCLDSLQNQTWSQLEIILVNDGSTDQSLAVAKKHQKADPRIRIFSQRNAGISAARNKALDLASGDFLLFCDSDDYINRDTVEKMMTAMQEEEADIVQCGYAMEFGPLPLVHTVMKRKVYETVPALHALVANKGLNNYPWGKLYRKSVFDQVRFPESVRGFEDTRTIFKTILNGKKTVIIPDVCCHYVQRRGSLTNRMDLKTVYDMREAYQYQERCLKEALPEETFSFDLNQYNTDMVIIYTLLVFSRKKDDPHFIPSRLDWQQLPPLFKPAYGLWLDLACLKFGWDPRSIPWNRD